MTKSVLEVERINRLYSALSHINQAVVRKRTRDELLRRVCEVLVDDGGLGMAWIGWHDPATNRLLPVAQAGDRDGYLQTVEVYADDRVEGRGPTGRAFRDNRPYICNDILADPATMPWRRELERRGFAASAVFPIQTNGTVGGTLSVYARRRRFFRDKETLLLTEAAADVSFALDNLARQDARGRAEAAVASEERVASTLLETMPGIFHLYDERGRLLRWNRNFERVSGYGSKEIPQMHPLDFFRAAERPLLRRWIAEVLGSGAATVEVSLVAKDGTTTAWAFTGERVVLDDAPRLVGVGVEIGQRKRAQEAHERSGSEHRQR